MTTMSVFNILFFLCACFCSLASPFRDRDAYPTIQEVISFRTPEQQTEAESEDELTIDIEKLDMHRIKKDDTAFRNQIMGGVGGHLLVQDAINKTIETRRLQTYVANRVLYDNIYRVEFRVKMADVMLQLVYMARSKIKSFESQGFLHKESSEYRVGIIIRKMENLYYKARRYFTVMVMKQNAGKWDTESTSILNLHHKIVMLHHDYMRLFSVQMALHERLEQIVGRPIHSRSEVRQTTTARR